MRVLTLLLSLLLLPLSAFAQDTSVSVQPKTVIAVRSAQGTAYVKVDTSLLRLPSGQKTFKQVEVPYSMARIKEMMKGKLNPAHVAAAAALAAILDGYDYAYDELTGQITQPGQPDPTYEPGYYFSVSLYPSGTYTSNSKTDLCSTYLSSWSTSNGYLGSRLTSTANYQCSGVLELQGANGADPYESPISDRFFKHACGTSTAAYCTSGQPMIPGAAVSPQEEVDLIMEAFNNLTPAQQRLFFEDLAGSPLVTPELAAALQAEADRIRDAEGLTDATVENPNGETDTANKPQEVTITDPIKIDESEVVTDPPTDDKYTRPEDYNPLTLFFGSLPDLPDFSLPDFGLSYSSSCRTITFDWEGASVLFPSSSQCSKLGEMKEITGWFISVITMFGIAWLILGNRKPGV